MLNDDALVTTRTLMHTMVKQMAQVVKGKDDFIKTLLTAFFAGGHILIEDVPGVGKTTMVKTLANLISDITQKRIQCTPDLLPYDITGVEVYEVTSAQFRFVKGPIFTDILLVDEINRATPKTQSALLEAMAEHQVTVAGVCYPLSSLFFVAATQNPVESEGAYPLPVAELDRFLMKVSPGYPSFDDECSIVKEDPATQLLSTIQPFITRQQVEEIKALAKTVHCDDSLIQLAVRLAVATRQHPSVIMGVSPRGPLALVQVAKVASLFDGRDYVTDKDILMFVQAVYAHRLILTDKRLNPSLVINEVVKQVTKNLYKGG